jgi:acetyl esterase/lipase
MVGPFAHFPSVAVNWPLALFPHRAIHFGWSEMLRSHPRPHEWDWRVSSLLASDETLRRTSPGIVTYHEFDTLCDEGRQYAERLRHVRRLVDASCMPYPHGSGYGMAHILGWVADRLAERLLCPADDEQTASSVDLAQ